MVKMLNAYTGEIDDTALAAQEILAQLDLSSLKRNSVGIISCYTEFVASDIIAALCEALPFDIVGATTMAAATGDNYGMYGLHLAVLTSDDVTFQTSVTSALTMQNYREEIGNAYADARGKLEGDASFVFTFLPLTTDMSGAILVERVSELAGGVPVFGTLSCDVSLKQDGCYAFRNTDSDRRCGAFILMRGEVNPRFIVSSMPARNVSAQKAVVTQSEGCLLKTVNNIKVSEYLTGIGVTSRSATGLHSVTVPLMVDYGDGSAPVAVRAYNIFENGDLLCGAIIPEGAVIAAGQIDRDGIIETVNAALDAISKEQDINGLFVISCASRYVTLTPQKDDEMLALSEFASGKIPFIFCYSGGEICPVNGSGGMSNRFHNYTFTACVF
jgi:hypothetical protein